MIAVGPEWMLPSRSTGEQYSSPLFNNGLKMFLKDSASVRPRTDSGRAERNAKCTPACIHIHTALNFSLAINMSKVGVAPAHFGPKHVLVITRERYC